MIPAKKSVGVTGQLPGESRRMKIDQDGMAYIMRMIIDLYSDRELAVLRELATNAIDSHIMAGTTRPIEVETPGPLANYLVIRDYGLGLAVNEVFDLFGNLGASTKRESNEVAGMLGVGSKSPLTYTNQFTMIATKDGVRATVSISRDEDGVGNLTVVDTRTTDEPNGVELRVPAKSGNTFERKARDLFRFWKKGTVKLNGQDPTGLKSALKLSDDLYLLSGQASDVSNYVVMGNVPYPVNNFLARTDLGLPFGFSIVAYVPIGSVEPTPSREALQSGRKVNELVAKIKDDYTTHLNAAIQRDIEDASSGMAALTALSNWRRLIPSGAKNSFKWRGKAVPATILAPTKEVKGRWGGVTREQTGRLLLTSVSTYSRRGENFSNISSIDLDVLTNTVFVTDFSPVKATGTHQRKMVQWLSKQTFHGHNEIRNFVAVDWQIPELELFDQRRVVAWDVVNQEKLPKQQPTLSGRLPGSYDVFYGGKKFDGTLQQYGIPGDKIDQQNNMLFYAHGNLNIGFRYQAVLDRFYDNYVIICLPQNRIPKFNRDHPQFKEVGTVIKERVKKLVDSLTEDEKKAVAVSDSRLGRVANAFKPHLASIKDPDIKEFLRLADLDIKKVLRAREQFQHEVRWPTTTVRNPFEKYTLLPYSIGKVTPEMIRYINAEWDYAVQCAGSVDAAKQGV